MTKMKKVGADSDMKLFRSLKVKKAQRVQERQRKRERKRERELDRRKCQVPGEEIGRASCRERVSSPV